MTTRYETLRRRALEADRTGRGGPQLDLLIRCGLPAWVAGLAPVPQARTAPPALRLPPAGGAARQTTALALLLSAMVLAHHKEEDP
jgi:hypothetical protein